MKDKMELWEQCGNYCYACQESDERGIDSYKQNKKHCLHMALCVIFPTMSHAFPPC